MAEGETRNMVVGVCHARRPSDGTFMTTLELPHKLGEHKTDKRFKERVRELVREAGFIVESVNVLVHPHKGIDVVVGVREKQDGMAAARRKPVAIGPNAIGSNRGDRKTLAQKQREQRRKRPK